MKDITEMTLEQLKQQCQQAQEQCFVNGKLDAEQVKKFSALVYQYQALKQQLAK